MSYNNSLSHRMYTGFCPIYYQWKECNIRQDFQHLSRFHTRGNLWQKLSGRNQIKYRLSLGQLQDRRSRDYRQLYIRNSKSKQRIFRPSH